MHQKVLSISAATSEVTIFGWEAGWDSTFICKSSEGY